MHEKSEERSPLQTLGIFGIANRLNDSAYFTFVSMMKTGAFKPTERFVIALVLINPTDESKFLAVKRPPNAKSLPDVWGLPAITLTNGEQPEIATSRLAKEKLNTQVEFLGCLGLASEDRGEHELILLDVVARLVGEEPSVFDATTEHTKYVQQQWTNDVSVLKEAAIKGSLCSRILLRFQGIPYE